MKCDICKAQDATVHLTEIIDSQVTKLHLCEECAKKKGEEMQSHFGLTDLVSSLMDFGPPAAEEGTGTAASIKCPVCSMSYFDFQKNGKFGCGMCYEAFKRDLTGLLKKIHGSSRHVGKMPYIGKRAVKDQEKLRELKKELDGLVRSEQFEKAAVVRDRIKELEDKPGNE